MQNIGVSCDVENCKHHCGFSNCDLAQIKITQQAQNEAAQSVDTPHFCQNYEDKYCEQ